MHAASDIYEYKKGENEDPLPPLFDNFFFILPFGRPLGVTQIPPSVPA
jgi:hypothetical protein